MYVAINLKLFRVNPQRAIQWAIRKETLIDIVKSVSLSEDWQDYTILYVR